MAGTQIFHSSPLCLQMADLFIFLSLKWQAVSNPQVLLHFRESIAFVLTALGRMGDDVREDVCVNLKQS